jgi:DNA-binding NarL/FixJ family response regulator
MKKVRLLIVDDHKLFREGIKMILEKESTIEIVGEAETGKDALKLVKELTPDVVLLDINLPDIKGDEVCKKIKKMYFEIKVVIISMHEEDRFIIELTKIGADAYLIKNEEPKKVRKAILDVFEKGKYHDERTISALKTQQKEIINPVSLTSQETEILKLIYMEDTSKEIAEKLNISIKTIEVHRKNLLRKTNSKNIAGLIKFAIKNKIPLFK